MTYSIIFTDSYQKRAKKFFKHHADILPLYEKVLNLLMLNPMHPSLRLHKLQGKLKSLYSVSINLQYGITLQLIIQDQGIVLIDIGSHDQIYS